jgi:hypothetical protein
MPGMNKRQPRIAVAVTPKKESTDLKKAMKDAGFATVEQLAVAANCSPATLYAAIREGRMPRNRAIVAAVNAAIATKAEAVK